MSREIVESVRIQNFKSVVDLSLELGTFNVLIGENGCGKSNILEALAFGAAASADKLDFEFLGSRGIRVTNPEFMFSAFEKNESRNEIVIYYKTNNEEVDEREYLLINDPDNPKKWIDETRSIYWNAVNEILTILTILNKKEGEILTIPAKPNAKLLKSIDEIRRVARNIKLPTDYVEMLKFILNIHVTKEAPSFSIPEFIIYSPEQSSLRKYEEPNQIYPLGIKGEGLFQYLKELASEKKNAKLLKDIKNNLNLLDWYENFDLPASSLSTDFTLNIKDKYLSPELQYFDQRSTNEGFLFLLFYSTLFLSKDTPSFFAIDNIDTSLNPKLCMQLTRNLAELAEKNGKQVIVTTQNPAILDGLNLKDDNQRLFVVRRDDEGHTKATRVEYKAERRMKLSEVWTSGFIGGLPENF